MSHINGVLTEVLGYNAKVDEYMSFHFGDKLSKKNTKRLSCFENVLIDMQAILSKSDDLYDHAYTICDKGDNEEVRILCQIFSLKEAINAKVQYASSMLNIKKAHLPI
jgi:hypothetical protein